MLFFFCYQIILFLLFDFRADGEKYGGGEYPELEVTLCPISFIFGSYFFKLFGTLGGRIISYCMLSKECYFYQFGFRNWNTLTRLCTLYWHLLTESWYISVFDILAQLPINMLGKAGAGDIDFMLLI